MKTKKEIIKFTQDELDLLGIMIETEASKANARSVYATCWADDYSCKDEIKSLWKKINKTPFPYSLKSTYEKQIKI